MNLERNWYASNSGPDSHNQAMIADEDTGKTIAVVYDRENAPIIAKACNEYSTTRRLLAEALEAIEMGFQADDYDVYGLQHNNITDLAIEIEGILRSE